MTKIAIANDHGGVELKQYLMAEFTDVEWINLGVDTTDSVDYPDIGYKLSECVAAGDADYGVAICGSGIGISMACNRNPKIRAAVSANTTMAKLTRIDNNANILCLGARLTGNLLAKEILQEFLNTPFESGGRHERRVNKLDTTK